MARINPPKLKPGDTIAIVATARKISLEELNPAIAIFESWGLNVFLHPNLFDQHHQFAGDDTTRARVFNDCLGMPDVKALICARGGYGTVRIIDKLNIEQLTKHPKWIVGYSDITVLHSHIHQHTNLTTIHGTMPINMQAHNANKISIESLRSALMDDTLPLIELPKHSLNKPGIMEGELIGGNLSVLYSLLGSTSDINTDGKILFIEDLDEYLYHIDRMMQAFVRAGKLTNLKGLIVGGMSDMKDNAIPFGQTAEEIIHRISVDYNYPVCFNFNAGHLDENLSLILGSELKCLVNQ